MAEFKLKIPIIKKSSDSGRLSQLFKSTNKEGIVTQVSTNENATIIGSFALSLYTIAFVYLFATSLWRKYFHSLPNQKSEPEWGFWGYSVKDAMEKKNSETDWGFTLSDALAHGEKIGATIFMVVAVSLIIGLQIEQGFIVKSNTTSYSGMRYSLIIFSFILLAAFLLLFWIPPSRNFFKMSVHVGIAFLILLYVLYASYVIVLSYEDFLKDEPFVNDIKYMGYTMSGIIILIMCGLFASIFSHEKYYMYVSAFIGIVEVVYIILFAGILGIFMQFPSLDSLNWEKICYGITDS